MDDDLLSLATISILENMCASPTIICINDSMESPTLESAQKTSSTDNPIAKETSTVQTDVSRTAELDFASNKTSGGFGGSPCRLWFRSLHRVLMGT
ncbi:hypothetical protein Bca101_082482 [Brassica carinata]